MYKHRAKDVHSLYVCRSFHDYTMYNKRAKLLMVMLSWCVLSWWERSLAVVLSSVHAFVGCCLFGADVNSEGC